MKRKKRLSALAAALAAALLFSACGGAAPAAEEKTEGTVMRSESLYVKKVENLPEDFILGMDISSVLAEERSGVVYRGFDGAEQDLFLTLAQSGVNMIRVRVWNDPYDAAGNGYAVRTQGLGGHGDRGKDRGGLRLHEGESGDDP